MNYHVKRVDALLETIKNDSIVMLVSGRGVKASADENYPFSVNRNFFYLTGIDEPDVIMMLIKTNKQSERYLFVKQPDHFMEKWVGKTISKTAAAAVSGIKQVAYVEELESYVNRYVKADALKNVYIDDEFDDIIHFGKDLIAGFKPLHGLNVLNAYQLIAKLRSVKGPEEITAIEKAIETTNLAIMNMLNNMKPGMNETEIEAYFDFILKSRKKEHSFVTIAAGGQRGTTLHYVANDQIVKDGELILFDLGAADGHYCADISRTFPINGKFTPRQREIYDIVLLAQHNVIAAIKPGVTTTDLQQITVETYQRELKRIGLIKKGTAEEVRKYYFHGVSHSLGLDTHDVGLERNEALRPGCIITVEPGLYIEEEGIGIRIEDDALVTEDGCRILSKDIIKDPEDIEIYFTNR